MLESTASVTQAFSRNVGIRMNHRKHVVWLFFAVLGSIAAPDSWGLAATIVSPSGPVRIDCDDLGYPNSQTYQILWDITSGCREAGGMSILIDGDVWDAQGATNPDGPEGEHPGLWGNFLLPAHGSSDLCNLYAPTGCAHTVTIKDQYVRSGLEW